MINNTCRWSPIKSDYVLFRQCSGELQISTFRYFVAYNSFHVIMLSCHCHYHCQCIVYIIAVVIISSTAIVSISLSLLLTYLSVYKMYSSFDRFHYGLVNCNRCTSGSVEFCMF